MKTKRIVLTGISAIVGTVVISVGVHSEIAAQKITGGTGTLFMGALPSRIFVIDESTEKITAEIALKTGAPRVVEASYSGKHLYVLNADMEDIEVVDTASRRVVDTFRLSEGDRKVRIWRYHIDPLERFIFLLSRSYTKLVDRFEIGPLTLIQYDLKQHRVVHSIDWPEKAEPECGRILFSPDGELLYLFSEDILIYDTSELKQVDTWEISRPVEEGMGRLHVGENDCSVDVANEEPGFFTDLFTVRDPLQDRWLMGVARLNLLEKSIDFHTLGPANEVSFSLAPGRKRAYGLLSEIGHYEFWTFDLENRRLHSRKEFSGRPRMELKTSSNGKLLYIYEANDTIDVYDADTYEYLRGIPLNADMRGDLHVMPSPK